MKQPLVNLFGPTKSDPSLSMKIYANQIFSALEHLKNRSYRIKLIQLQDKNLPLFKNFFSKDLYYPILSRIMSADINHITDHSHGLLALFLRPEKTIVTCHDLNAIVFKNQSSSLGKVRFWLNVLAMKRAKNIVVNSCSTKETIHKYLGYKGRITVTYLAANSIYSPIPDAERSGIRKKLGIKPNDKVLLHVGNSNPVKNVELILHILLKLKNYKLLKVGNFNKTHIEYIKKNKLENRIIVQDNPKIEIIKEAYNIADLLIFPSFVEGFGLPVLEAMSCGCPVICSKTSSLSEVGGAAAIYFNPNDESSVVKAIRRVDSDKQFRENTIRKGFAQAKKFSWHKNALQLDGLYRSMLSEKE